MYDDIRNKFLAIVALMALVASVMSLMSFEVRQECVQIIERVAGKPETLVTFKLYNNTTETITLLTKTGGTYRLEPNGTLQIIKTEGTHFYLCNDCNEHQFLFITALNMSGKTFNVSDIL